MIKSAYNVGDPRSIPGSGRFPGEGNGNLLQYSCLENPMDGGAWLATVHGITRVGHDCVTEPPPRDNNHVSESSGCPRDTEKKFKVIFTY